MVYAQPRICPGKWDIQTPLGFWNTNGLLNLSQTTRPNNSQQKKKKRTCQIVDFAVPVDHRVKLKESKKDKYLDLARELKKLWNMKVTLIAILIGTLGTFTKRLIQGLEDLEIRRDHPNYSFFKISQNTEKSPGNLRRLAITQTWVRNHCLMLMGNTLKRVIIIIIMIMMIN